jgi:putative oxidoreductase
MINDINDEVILAARLFLATLFLIFGWRKLRDYSGTVSQMVQDGVPMPVLATAVAIFMELPVAFAVAAGAFTRPSAVLLVFYTLGTSLIEHHYWTMTEARIDSPAWRAFTKTSALWEASCCCTLLVRENIRSMYCAASPRHDLCAIGATMQRHVT